jgi:hypothetical protein
MAYSKGNNQLSNVLVSGASQFDNSEYLQVNHTVLAYTVLRKTFLGKPLI